jgi:hypothetical protein
VYQLVVRIEQGSWDLSGWECVGVGSTQHHKAQEGALGGLVGAKTFGETLAGALQARGNH